MCLHVCMGSAPKFPSLSLMLDDRTTILYSREPRGRLRRCCNIVCLPACSLVPNLWHHFWTAAATEYLNKTDGCALRCAEKERERERESRRTTDKGRGWLGQDRYRGFMGHSGSGGGGGGREERTFSSRTKRKGKRTKNERKGHARSSSLYPNCFSPQVIAWPTIISALYSTPTPLLLPRLKYSLAACPPAPTGEQRRVKTLDCKLQPSPGPLVHWSTGPG